MRICHFHIPSKGARLGLVQEGQVYDLTAADADAFGSFRRFLDHPAPMPLLEEMLPTLKKGASIPWEEMTVAPDPGRAHLLPPMDVQEIWGAGVTYKVSEEARMEEAEVAGGDFYALIYRAERPELFFKATPNRTVGPYDKVRIRQDSNWDVPEPEMGLVLSPQLRLVGFTICNDMSSREIEGKNPLYLPQAKIFKQCFSCGPTVLLAEAVNDPGEMTIELRIFRDGREVSFGETSFRNMIRPIDVFIDYLGRDNEFPTGVILSTGTGVVPEGDFTLRADDRVEITVEPIGTLVNTVVRGD